MNKILRYSFMALLAMMAGNVMATEITFLPSEFAAATSSNYSLTKDGVTVAVTSSTVTADQFRIFKSQTITISSTAGNITKAVFTCTAEGDAKYGPGCFSEPTTGSYAYEGAVGTWTGEATEFSMTAATNQVRATSIVVTVSGAPSVIVEVPKFSIASGLYLETQSVAMSCEEGARILYTVAVGNDPEYIDDENYTGVFYDGNPLTVSKSTIIKAMAVKNGKTSNIVTANYTIVNTTGKGTVESPFSVADALLVVDALDNGQKTADEYVIKGNVTEVTEISLDYGNATFKIADAGSADVLTVFRAKDANGENITDENYVKVGDKVAVQGKLQKYVSGETVTPEVAQGGKILSVESEVPLPELPTVDQQPIYKFTAKGQWGSYTFNKTPFRAADYKGFRIEYSNMNEVSEGAAFNILINSNETHLGQDWSGAEAQVPNKTAYKNFGFDAAHTVFEGDFSDFVATDDPTTTCPTIAQFALQACAAGNTVIIKKVVFIKQDNTEVLPEYKGDDWGGGAYTIEEVTDGINTINVDKAENGVRYNLAGQKVNNGFKGVVIMNGKKMLQK